MKILNKYVLKEHVGPLLFAWGVERTGSYAAGFYGLSTAGLYDIQGFMSAAGVRPARVDPPPARP